MQLVQVKRLGPRKFYLYHKGNHVFIKGNPSSHKGWMSRLFFVKRVGKKRDPWKSHRSVNDTRKSFDDAMGQHSELVARLEELEALRAQEKRETEKTAVEVELEETKARAKDEAGHLMSEAINAWDLDMEEFLQSSEFGSLCAKKALGYFKVGLSGCLAQFRANGYSEEEHPTSFLDVKEALMDMADEEEVEEEEEEEEEEKADANPPNSPSLSCIYILQCTVTFVV
ncbi:hypothetical protein F511_27229 [Dorcoceras hygrometricum]|uniref:Uncharacterized protein n=1 Tax=Dorcoceras hygrometricum TaxID=472368 RepID=A0A2Z7BDQ8_9LAMI|nr:hypothetical protein F511_27229 [Dorcoceras hygrometricum]